MNETQFKNDLMCCKALIFVEDYGIRWYRCMILGVNDRGEYHVRRIRTGQEAITTQVRNLTDKDRKYLRNNYL